MPRSALPLDVQYGENTIRIVSVENPPKADEGEESLSVHTGASQQEVLEEQIALLRRFADKNVFGDKRLPQTQFDTSVIPE